MGAFSWVKGFIVFSVDSHSEELDAVCWVLSEEFVLLQEKIKLTKVKEMMNKVFFTSVWVLKNVVSSPILI